MCNSPGTAETVTSAPKKKLNNLKLNRNSSIRRSLYIHTTVGINDVVDQCCVGISNLTCNPRVISILK